MRRSLILYLVAVLGSASLLLALAWLDAAPPNLPWEILSFWLFLSLAAEIFWLETPTGKGMVSTGLAINMAMLFVLSSAQVLAVGALSVALSDVLLHRRGVLKASFNAAQTTISLAASLAVMGLLGYKGSLVEAVVQHPLATVAAPISFFCVNTMLVSIVISLDNGTSLWRTWRANYGFAYQVLSSTVLFLLGVTFVASYERFGYVSGLCYLVFLFFVRDSYHRYVRERRAATEAPLEVVTADDIKPALGVAG